MSLELNQNNCSSFKVFKTVFIDGLCDLISHVSLNRNSFQLSTFSRTMLLLLIWLMLNLYELTSVLLTLKKSNM